MTMTTKTWTIVPWKIRGTMYTFHSEDEAREKYAEMRKELKSDEMLEVFEEEIEKTGLDWK